MCTCRQCGSWSVAGHNHRKVIGRDPICASWHDMGLSVHQRSCMTREMETWLSDSRVGSNSVVDYQLLLLSGFTSSAIQCQHHQLSAVAAAQPPAWSLHSCWQHLSDHLAFMHRAHVGCCCKAPLLSAGCTVALFGVEAIFSCPVVSR